MKKKKRDSCFVFIKLSCLLSRSFEENVRDARGLSANDMIVYESSGAETHSKSAFYKT